MSEMTPEELQKVRDRTLYGLLYNHLSNLESAGIQIPDELMDDARVLESLSGMRPSDSTKFSEGEGHAKRNS
jgi:hypothetical protein